MIDSQSLMLSLFVTILGCLVVFFTRLLLIKKNPTQTSSTEEYEYVASKATLQYTGKSYSKTFGKLLGFSVSKKKKYEEIESVNIFPKERKYSSYYVYLIEKPIIEKITNLLHSFMNVFQFIQYGSIQIFIKCA